ncbi:MAG: helix-turn-helix transcriptional regulator [bacterium]
MMTAAEVTVFRTTFGFSEKELAKFLNVDPRTVRAWENGETPPKETAVQVMAGLQEAWRRSNGSSVLVSYVRNAMSIGGLAYLLVKLIDDWFYFAQEPMEEPNG